MSNERLATVEARVENIGSRLDEIHKDVREIRDTLANQRGFITATKTIVVALWAALGAVVAYLFKGSP